MATPKKTTTRRAPRASPGRATSSKADTGIAARTGRTIKRQPYTSAAIAAGAVTAVAAAVAGLLLFRRSDKSFGEFTTDVTTRVKDGLTDVGAKAKDTVTRFRDGLDDKFASQKNQSEIAEEALTLKQTGKTTTHPVDPVVEEQTSGGVVH